MGVSQSKARWSLSSLARCWPASPCQTSGVRRWRPGSKHQTPSADTTHERTRSRRAELEAEQKRLALAFTKGVISEETLDEQAARIRAELVVLPLPQVRDTASAMQAALDAGETLADMASY